MSRLLEGIKVVDLTHVLAGPYCTYQLGPLGAEVTRIEHPASPDLPRVIDQDPRRRASSVGAAFITANANKRSVAVDFTIPRGQQIIRRLVAEADVMIENFRPGVLEKHGLGAEAMTGLNPRLIYCSISGFGQRSSWKNRPAYDDIIQAMSGLMAVTGTEQSGPVMAGFPVIDYITGLMAAFAIAAAVVRQVRTGEGEVLDVAMLDSAMSIMGTVFATQNIANMPIALRGNLSFSGSPFSGLYECVDGSVIVAANTPAKVAALFAKLELSQLLDIPAVRDWRDNPGATDIIRARLRESFQHHSADHWEIVLSEASVPAGKLRNMPEMLNEHYLRERGFVHQTHVTALEENNRCPAWASLPAAKTATWSHRRRSWGSTRGRYCYRWESPTRKLRRCSRQVLSAATTGSNNWRT